MKKELKKQIAIGIFGVLGTALVAAACYAVLGFNYEKWVLYASLAVLTASFFGFLLYIFMGRKGLFTGAKWGFGFVAFSVAAKELPFWLFGILIVAAVVFFVVRPLIRQYKIDREMSGEKVIDRKIAQEVKMAEAVEKEAMEEDDELKKSIGFGEKSLLVFTQTGGIYQLIKGTDRFFVLRIGGQMSGLDMELMKTDFTDEASFIENKKDYYIKLNEIVGIECKYGRVNAPMDNCGKLTIRSRHKKYVFAVLDNVSESKLKAFFSGVPFTLKSKKRKTAAARELTGKEKRILPNLKKAVLALSISSFIAGAAFLFLPVDAIFYRILSAICILIPSATFVLYVKFNTLMSIEDKRSGNSSTFSKSGVNITLPLLIPSAVLGIRTLMDFDIIGWENLIIWSAVVIAVVLFVMFKFTKEYRRFKSVIFFIIFVFLYYAPAAAVQVNCLYDYSAPVVNKTVISDKHISESDHGDKYYFTITLESGRQKNLKVTKGFFDKRNKGGIVTVVENSGLLGINYAYIDEDE